MEKQSSFVALLQSAQPPLSTGIVERHASDESKEVQNALYPTRHQGKPNNQLEHATTSHGNRFYFIVLVHCRFSSEQHVTPTANY